MSRVTINYFYATRDPRSVGCYIIVIVRVFYLSLAMDEFLDMDLGDTSKSESDLYRNDSRRCGKFCSTRPADGDVPPPSSGDLPGLVPAPFSTSKLKTNIRTSLMKRLKVARVRKYNTQRARYRRNIVDVFITV